MRRILRFGGQVIALTIAVALVSAAWGALTDRIFGPGTFLVDVGATAGGKTTTFSLVATVSKQGQLTGSQNTDFGSLPDEARAILATLCPVYTQGANDAWPRLDEVHGSAHGSWKLNARGGVNFVMLRHRFERDTGRYIGWVRVSGVGKMDGTGTGTLEYLPAGDPLAMQPVCAIPLTFRSRKVPSHLQTTTASKSDTDPEAATASSLLELITPRVLLSAVRGSG